MDTEGLLRSLKEHKVEFVIIGATAFPVYGYARATLDKELLKKKLLIRQYAVETDIHPFVRGIGFSFPT